MIDEHIDDIQDNLESVQSDHALSDRAVGAAIQMFVRTGEFPEGSIQEDELEVAMLETAWLFFMAAPAVRPRYLLVSSMHLSLVMSGERPLEAIFEELRSLDPDAEPDIEPPRWFNRYRSLATKPLPEKGARIERLRNRFDQARTILRDHHEEVLEFSQDLFDTLASDFDQQVEQGAITPMGADPAGEVEDPDEAFEMAEQKQREGDLDAALHLYSTVLEQRPDDTEARVQRGILRATLEDLEGACVDFDRVLEQSEDHVVARLNRGLARHSLGEVEKAIEDYDHALEQVDDDPEIWANRGISRFSNDDFEGALQDLNKAIELDTSMAVAYYHRGNVHRVLGDIRSALADYDKALDLESEFADAWAARGFLYLQLGDEEDSLADLDEAIELQPSDPELYYNRAYAHLMNEDVEAAIEDYDQALQLDPEDVESLTNRGAAHMMNGDLEQAAQDWERAISIDPYYPAPYAKRATMWIANENYEQAIEDLEIALEHAPEDWEHRREAEEELEQLREKVE